MPYPPSNPPGLAQRLADSLVRPCGGCRRSLADQFRGAEGVDSILRSQNIVPDRRFTLDNSFRFDGTIARIVSDLLTGYKGKARAVVGVAKRKGRIFTSLSAAAGAIKRKDDLCAIHRTNRGILKTLLKIVLGQHALIAKDTAIYMRQSSKETVGHFIDMVLTAVAFAEQSMVGLTPKQCTMYNEWSTSIKAVHGAAERLMLLHSYYEELGNLPIVSAVDEVLSSFEPEREEGIFSQLFPGGGGDGRSAEEALVDVRERMQAAKHALTMVRDVADREAEPYNAKGSVLLATVHGTKGEEYETVLLADDFTMPASFGEAFAGLVQLLKEGKKIKKPVASRTELINFIYVALTRCKSNLVLNAKLASVYRDPGLDVTGTSDGGGGIDAAGAPGN